MWMARRTSVSASWQAPVNLGPAVNSPIVDCVPRVSFDGSTLYFATSKGMGTSAWEYWRAPIVTIVDFNGDGKVDVADVAIMIEHWHTDYSLCDIGPMPWGDGFVDAQDLIVLAEHMANNPGDVNDVNDIQ
jgi:hypothetical protein